MSVKRDLTGKRFGRLVVIEIHTREPYYAYKGPRWRCRCDCGAETVVAGQSLEYGYTRSCGCLRRDRMREMHRRAKEAGCYASLEE